MKTSSKIIIASVVGILFIVGILWWAITESNKPLPGQAISDIGRDHVSDISGIKYNSNPPTSGKHFPIWAKPGVYDRVLSDGYLIHSLEHGYVVISYNCEKKFQISNFKFPISNAYAHEGEDVQNNPTATESAAPLHRMNIELKDPTMSAFTPENPPAKEVELPSSFSSNECKKLVSELSSFLKDWKRLIIVPRLNLDAPIAVTAWGKIEKLESLDKEKIKEFIAAFHNKGNLILLLQSTSGFGVIPFL